MAQENNNNALNFSSTDFRVFSLTDFHAIGEGKSICYHTHEIVHTRSISHFISSWGFNELSHAGVCF